MTLDDSVHTFRLRVMARAHALGNVTRACREVGISRTLFYRPVFDISSRKERNGDGG